MANWSRIRRIAGPCGTYCYGSLERLDVSRRWMKEFFRQAWAQRCRAVVRDGHLYLEIIA